MVVLAGLYHVLSKEDDLLFSYGIAAGCSASLEEFMMHGHRLMGTCWAHIMCPLFQKCQLPSRAYLSL